MQCPQKRKVAFPVSPAPWTCHQLFQQPSCSPEAGLVPASSTASCTPSCACQAGPAMAEEMGVHRSADSLSVHKARLSRPKVMDEAEEDEDLDMEDQPDSPAADTEVQARIDSVALAKKRMDGKKGALKGSDSEPKPAKSRFGAARARFADDEPEAKQPAPESPTKKTPTMVTGGLLTCADIDSACCT